ncbi:MAG: putative sulfate exporter family transporter [Ferruginibacter sp.]
MSNTAIKFSLHEDWVVVILGFLIIGLAVMGLRPVSPVYNWAGTTDLAGKVLSIGNLTKIGIQFLFLLAVAFIGVLLTGKPVKFFLYTFSVVYIITVAALIIAGNNVIKSFNLEVVIFSLAIGLIISNLFNLPEWFRNSLSTELFVKIGLVILGTSIIFSDIVSKGAAGLLQALIVVISVWYFAYWLCKKMKIDGELTMMIASAVSICGVSAAIATAGAIQGDTKKLSYVISLVLICAIPMMIGMPYLAQMMGLSQEVTGAWLGGSIDTTGAVIASGKIAGDEAVKISTIVKFSQNVLLGIAAFVISVYWTYNKKAVEGTVQKPTLGVIWERFPKFVLGFIAASFLFSFILNATTVLAVKESLKNIQSAWFALAFTSIGLETKFSDLFKGNSFKPMFAFLIAQLFNVLVTLIVAYLLFR